MRNFDKVDKDFLKKKLEYKEYSMSQQNELLGLDRRQLREVLEKMKASADETYRKREFADAIELYLKGGSFYWACICM